MMGSVKNICAALYIFLAYNCQSFVKNGFPLKIYIQDSDIKKVGVDIKYLNMLGVNKHRRCHFALYGIPKLFRWLVDLYPVVTSEVSEGFGGKVRVILATVKFMQGVEFESPNFQVDNFYLDMNGIIHSCTHSNNDRFEKYRHISPKRF